MNYSRSLGMTLNDARSIFNLRMSGSQKLQSENSHALTAIHELLHFSFGDLALANGVAALNKDEQRFVAPQYFEASLYWGAELRKHCGTQE